MVASRYMNRKESSLPVNLRHPKTSLLKLPIDPIDHFEVVRGTGTVLCRSALWDCFRNAIVSYWLVKSCVGNKVKIFQSKNSRSAIRNNIWPIERRSVTSRYHGSKIFG